MNTKILSIANWAGSVIILIFALGTLSSSFFGAILFLIIAAYLNPITNPFIKPKLMELLDKLNFKLPISNEKIIYIALFVLFVIAANTMSNPGSSVSSEEDLIEYIEKRKNNADISINEYKSCNDAKCKGKSVFLTFDYENLSSAEFRGESKKRRTIKGEPNIEFGPKNVTFNDDKSITVDFYHTKKTFSNQELRASKLTISGNYLAANWTYPDVLGELLSVDIDQNKLATIIQKDKEKAALAEKRALEAAENKKILASIPDGKLKYYSKGHKDNNINWKQAKALCNKFSMYPTSQAYGTAMVGEARIYRDIIRNGSRPKFVSKFWSDSTNTCWVTFNVSGTLKGTNYSKDFNAKAKGFTKNSITYMSGI